MKSNRAEMLERFRKMIRIPTISGEGRDEEPFRSFRALVRGEYPLLFEEGEGWGIGDRGILIRIPGRGGNRPSVLMAHYDVVPAEGSGWICAPFAAELRDGRIYGRGTLDTKCTLFAILEAAAWHMKNGRRPESDLYLAFGGEEEISGPCAGQIASYLESLGVKPALVLDEGGAVSPDGVPGLRRQTAMIGISEKGTANYLLSIERQGGGHASTPPRSTLIGQLAKAVVRIESHPFPARMTEPVRLMFREIARQAPAPKKAAFARPELFAPFLDAGAAVLGKSVNAMVRTTCAVTVMEGHSSYNVLPDRAAVGVNVRLLHGDTVESARQQLIRIIKDPEIRVDLIGGTDPSPVSDISCREYGLLTETISEIWPGTGSVPYPLNGGTDARFYTGLTDHVYRFSPVIMTEADRASIHGDNESIAVRDLMRMTAFYIRLMEKLA